jgi:Flp pilus assembly protein TadB
MENKEPSGDNAAKQEPTGEEYKQEAQQLFRLQRQHLLAFDPSLLIGISNVYLLFVTAVVAFGVLAYYSGHLTILKAVFVVSGLLLLVLPVSAAWYLWPSFKKTPKNKTETSKEALLVRIARSPAGRFLTRLADNRIFKLYQYSFPVAYIAWAIIRVFPLYPRVALAVIALFIAFFLWSVIHDVDRYHARSYRHTVESFVKISELLEKQFLLSEYTRTLAESSKDFIVNAEPRHQKVHEDIATALDALHNSTKVLASAIFPTEPDDRLDAPAIKDDKAPNDG